MNSIGLPMRVVTLLLCITISSCEGRSESSVYVHKLTYHNDRQRTGWNMNEHALTIDAVSNGYLAQIWQSPKLDAADGSDPRLFASPLYVHEILLTAGSYRGERLAVAFAAAGSGYVYAIGAEVAGDVPAGTILWRQQLSTMPCRNGRMGILGTPVIDLVSNRLYVVSCDNELLYRLHALELGSGRTVEGWPVAINHLTVNKPGINRNGSNQFPDNTLMLQRGALNISWDGSRVYVPFGKDSVSGWLVAVDTKAAQVASAFSTTAITAEHQGGMWASSGPSIDPEGRIHIATGASYIFAAQKAGIAGTFPDSEHNWGQSIIQLTDDTSDGLQLTGTYTPFDYCPAQAADIDLGSSGTIAISLDAASTSTPHVLALVGGKQGNAYLLDRNQMPGSLVKRQPCSDDSSTDKSLLAPYDQPHFGQLGPVNVFGPYSVDFGWFDHAKSRTTASYYNDGNGNHYLYATGNTKEAVDSAVSVPPSLARLKIVTRSQEPAYLEIDSLEKTLVFKNPGSPVISSNGSKDAIVWILDENASRTASLWDDETLPQPILYAIDATTLKLLWKSSEGELSTSGVYNEPTVVNGTVLVGTDRIQAFGLKPH